MRVQINIATCVSMYGHVFLVCDTCVTCMFNVWYASRAYGIELAVDLKPVPIIIA